MNKRQEQQIVDYYSTTDRYIRSDRYSDSNQTVFAKENWQKRKGRHGAMKQSRYEQETIVSYNAGEQTATIYTRDKAVM